MTLSLEPLDLAALLCSRVCHDVISPVGAIVNGLEVLEDEKDPEMRAHAVELIKKSAAMASAKLQFCRLAFGAAGSAGAAIDTGDAEKVTRGLLIDDRIKLDWSAPRVLMPKNLVKLLLNLTLIALNCIPRGGTIKISSAGEGPTGTVRVDVHGTHIRLAPGVVKNLVGDCDPTSIDAHAIQPYFTHLVAQSVGLRVAVDHTDDHVVFETMLHPAASETLEVERVAEGDVLAADMGPA